MKTYFLSFSNKKDLQRVKKDLQRNGIEHTVNSKFLFIMAISDSAGLNYSMEKYGCTQTIINLHPKHPSLKAPINENLTPLPFVI